MQVKINTGVKMKTDQNNEVESQNKRCDFPTNCHIFWILKSNQYQVNCSRGIRNLAATSIGTDFDFPTAGSPYKSGSKREMCDLLIGLSAMSRIEIRKLWLDKQLCQI